MKKFRKFLLSCALCVSAVISLAYPAFAEGSRELVETPHGAHDGMEAYRPYLEWRDRLQLGDMSSKNVIYVYANKGETVYFGSSVKSANETSIKAVVGKADGVTVDSSLIGSTIAVTMPLNESEKDKAYDPTNDSNAVFVEGSTISSAGYGDKNVYLFKPDLGTQQGLIVNLEQEENGPQGVIDSSVTPSKGYKPMSFVAPVDGTYAFRFLSTEYSTQDIPDTSINWAEGKTLNITFDQIVPTATPAATEEPTTEEPTAEEQESETATSEDEPVSANYASGPQIGTSYTFTDGNISINLKLNALESEKRYFTIKNNDTAYWTEYPYYLDASTGGSNVSVEFFPPKEPAKIDILWSFDETTNNRSMKLRVFQGTTRLNLSTNGYSDPPVSDTDRNYTTTVYTNGSADPIKIYSDEYAINIHAIKYTYLPDEQKTEEIIKFDDVTIPDVLKPVDGAPALNKPGSVEVSGTGYINAIKLDSLKKSDTSHFDSTTGLPKKNAIVYTPQYNGTISVDAYTNDEVDGIANIYVTQNPSNAIPVCTTTERYKLYTTKDVAVEAGKPVYIYGTDGNIFVCGIKYSYTKDAAALAAGSVKYTFDDYPTSGIPEELTLVGLTGPAAIKDDVQISVNGAGEYSYSIKINPIGNNINSDGTPRKNAIMYTPPYNGTISVDAFKDVTGNTILYVTQDPKNASPVITITNNKTLYKTDEIEIEAGKPVYIYSADSSVYFCGINVNFAASAQEDVEPITDEPLARKIDEKWIDSPSIVSAWDVTVADENGNVKEGRAWSDVLVLNAGNHMKSIYSNFYILTKDGFEYQFDSNGMQPYGFAFYANNRGFLLDRFSYWTVDKTHNYLQSFAHSYYSAGTSDSVGDAPLYQEYDTNGNPVIVDGKVRWTRVLPNYTPTNSEKDYNHKIFFNKVENGNPVLEAYTTPKQLADDDSITQKATDVNIQPSYTGLGVQAGLIDGVEHGTKGVGGNFTFEVTPEQLEKVNGSSYNITLDFSSYELDENNKPVLDGSGAWKKLEREAKDAEAHNIVVLSNYINGEGKYTITWNGKDNYGNNVPEGVYGTDDNNGGVLHSYLEMGTVHFPIADVERAPKGIKVQMLNNDIAFEAPMGKDIVYYNNDGTYQTKPEYFMGRESGQYPSKIADGINATGGVSTNFSNPDENGALVMTSYNDEDSANAGNITDAQKAYGNYCAIDVASRYAKRVTGSLTIGVAEPKSADSLAAVSFVGEKNMPSNIADTKAAATFDQSHVLDMENVTPEGEPIKTYTSAQGRDDLYGNTISTGFIADITPGNNNSFNWIEWDIEIPLSSTYESYIKIPDEEQKAGLSASDEFEEFEISLMDLFGEEAFDQDVSLSFDDGFEDLGDDPNAGEVLNEYTYTSTEEFDSADSPAISNWNDVILTSSILTDSDAVETNKGSIYKLQGNGNYNKLRIKLKYQFNDTEKALPLLSGEGKFSYGIVIDNLYAPNARATATFTNDTEQDDTQIITDENGVVNSDNADEYHNSSEYGKVN